MSNEKNKALGIAIAKIEKDYGKGAIMKMGEASKMKIDSIPTGALSLDLALGVGGLPRGRIVEIYGPEGGGKTTVSLHVIAEAQKKGGIAAFIDAEHAMDPLYARRLGVDINNLLISQPDYGEQALEICETLVRSGAVDIIVVDSVAALVPKKEIEGEMEDIHVGLQARLMSKALRKLAGVINKSKTTVIFINQLRMKIGIMFGNPETTPGGRALKFYSSVRLEVRAGEKITDGDVIIGSRVKVKVVKNKVAPPFRTASFVLIHGKGISKEVDLIDLAIDQKVINKAGAWYTYDQNKLGQGLVNAQAFLKENPATMNDIEKKIKVIIASQNFEAETPAPKTVRAKSK
ncbi:MAG: recombinase RecA [Candidatus Margulisbacteria bacterium]|nr:recombinase RecA [Candidatus Margulisiibacteriota bacterium]MBU1021898.1 recombinase RecA [Candidatus Margulisiibacteriota bacterium]MBU1728536.1 recombinase RecA [Candidatus Margulisiibacteriota bacterium]MBU1954683.1 recombinase RecA [Candidatus Margulisiibacteriota bacterium]